MVHHPVKLFVFFFLILGLAFYFCRFVDHIVIGWRQWLAWLFSLCLIARGSYINVKIVFIFHASNLVKILWFKPHHWCVWVIIMFVLICLFFLFQSQLLDSLDVVDWLNLIVWLLIWQFLGRRSCVFLLLFKTVDLVQFFHCWWVDRTVFQL